MKKVIIYTDGACRGNPGPAGAGALINSVTGETLAEVSEYLGEGTNNIAEYKAVILGLEKAIALGATEAEVFTDSQLLVRQVKGEYRVKNEGLKPLFKQVKLLQDKFNKFSINHISREKNKEADKLANASIDKTD